jgi:hypothetical protein
MGLVGFKAHEHAGFLAPPSLARFQNESRRTRARDTHSTKR